MIQMYKINLEKGVKVNIWLNEHLAECRCDDGKIIIEEQTNLYAKSRKIILELFLPRAHGNYALLGIDFLANGAGKCIIRWDIDCLKQERHSDAMAFSFDTVIWGMLDEFQEGIVQLNDILLSLLICGELNESIMAKIVQEKIGL